MREDRKQVVAITDEYDWCRLHDSRTCDIRTDTNDGIVVPCRGIIQSERFSGEEHPPDAQSVGIKCELGQWREFPRRYGGGEEEINMAGVSRPVMRVLVLTLLDVSDMLFLS